MRYGAKVILCSFDVDLREDIPKRKGMTPNEKDIETLKRANRVSIFWITENMRRARLITRLEKSDDVKFDRANHGYPWLSVVYVK